MRIFRVELAGRPPLPIDVGLLPKLTEEVVDLLAPRENI